MYKHALPVTCEGKGCDWLVLGNTNSPSCYVILCNVVIVGGDGNLALLEILSFFGGKQREVFVSRTRRERERGRGRGRGRGERRVSGREGGEGEVEGKVEEEGEGERRGERGVEGKGEGGGRRGRGGGEVEEEGEGEGREEWRGGWGGEERERWRGGRGRGRGRAKRGWVAEGEGRRDERGRRANMREDESRASEERSDPESRWMAIMLTCIPILYRLLACAVSLFSHAHQSIPLAQ